MNDLQPILDLLIKQWPWLIKLASGIGFARLAIKPIGAWLKDLITRAANNAISSSDTLDDHWIELLLACRPWRIFVFLLDLFASVKLPVAEDLFSKQTPP